MEAKRRTRAIFTPLLCLAAVWGNAQPNEPTCAPLSAKHESIDCWLGKAGRMLKGKQLEEATAVLRELGKYTGDQPLFEAHRLSLLGNACWAKNDWDSSYLYAAAAARIYSDIKHFAGASASYKSMGAAMIRKSELDKAVPLFYKAIELADQAGKDSLKALPYMDLAYIFGQFGDENKRRSFITIAYAISKKYKDQKMTAITGMNLAMSYIEASMLDSARLLARQTLREMEGNNYLRACSHYSLALWETVQGNWDAANQYYLKIKNDGAISNDQRIGYLQAYANFLKDRKMYDKAKPIYEDVLEQARRLNQTDLLYAVANDFHPILEEMKDYKRAYEVAKEYMAIHDSIYTLQAEEKIREINIKYETAEKERALQASKLELSEHTNQRNLLLGGVILIGLLGTIVVLRQRFRMRLARKLLEQEAQIAQQKIERLQQEQNYLAFKSMVTGEEAERNRLAKELHDGLGGMLSNLKLTLTNRNHCLDDMNCREIVQIVDKASVELRRIAHNLIPEALSRFGLISALEDLCAELESHTRLKAEFQHYGVREPLPQVMLLPLYRIVQESLNNVVKHAGATEVMLQLVQQGDELHLTIEDNGVGFQWEKAFENGGNGLKNLQSRVAFLNGHIEFDSMPDAGTAINIDIPVN